MEQSKLERKQRYTCGKRWRAKTKKDSSHHRWSAAGIRAALSEHTWGSKTVANGDGPVGTVGVARSDNRWCGQDFESDWYCSNGPVPILTVELIFQYSNHLQNLKFKTKIFLMSKNIQTWHEN
jgi:hypothetical protein